MGPGKDTHRTPMGRGWPATRSTVPKSAQPKQWTPLSSRSSVRFGAILFEPISTQASSTSASAAWAKFDISQSFDSGGKNGANILWVLRVRVWVCGVLKELGGLLLVGEVVFNCSLVPWEPFPQNSPLQDPTPQDPVDLAQMCVKPQCVCMCVTKCVAKCVKMCVTKCVHMGVTNSQRSSLRSQTFARFARTFFNSLNLNSCRKNILV